MHWCINDKHSERWVRERMSIKKESPPLRRASGNGWYKESGLKCLLMACNGKPHKSLSAASFWSWALCVGCNLHGWATLSLPISLQCRESNRIRSQRFSQICLLFCFLFTLSLSACFPFLKYYMVKYYLYSLNVIMKSKLTILAFLMKVTGLTVRVEATAMITSQTLTPWSS